MLRPIETLQVARPQEPTVEVSDSTTPVWVSQWATRLSLIVFDGIGLLLVVGFLALATGPGVGLRLGPADLALMAATLVALLAGVGLYRQIVVHPAVEMRRLGTVTGAVGVAAAVAAYAVTDALATALVVASAGVLAAVVLPGCRALGRILMSGVSWWGLPAVVVGDEHRVADILDTLRRWPEIGLRPVATVETPAGVAAGGDGHSEPPVYDLCSTEALNLSRHLGVPYVLLADAGLSHAVRTRRLSHYSKFFDHVVVVGNAAGPAIWKTEPSTEGLFGYDVRHFALQPVGRFIKRAVDLVGAGLALIGVAPLFAAIAVLIRMDSPGAVFYRQERMGRDGRIFTVLKFRTMFVDAEAKLEEILARDPVRRAEYERYHKLQDDPRVTTIGRILRRLSLDELPQILNVLRGDMSLVGPRAYMPGELGKMKGLAQTVLQTPPGITGLWQVSGRNNVSFAMRVDLDVHYVQNWTPWLDLYLLVRTVPVVLSGKGAS
jgi:Undecaprenyl-phosphate galactose phosphotransferase WbaP